MMNDGNYFDYDTNNTVMNIPLHANVFSSLQVYDVCEENVRTGNNDGINICDNVFSKQTYDAKKCCGRRRNKNNLLSNCENNSNFAKLEGNSTQTNTSESLPATNDRLKKGIKICHLNAQSLLSCFDELKLWLQSKSYNIITLSETWIDDTVHNSEIHIPGYVCERKDRNRHGGGTAVYLRDDIEYIRRQDVEKDNNESIWLEIKQEHKKPIVIGCLYRPQTESVDYFNLLAEMVDGLINDNKEVMLFGDLNCDFLKTHSLTTHMSTFMEMYNLEQMVTKPTRITPTSKSLIDIILTTNSNLCCNTDVIHHSFSDHGLVETTIPTKIKMKRNNSTKHDQKEFRSFKHFDVDSFVKDLENVDWDINESRPVTLAWNSFARKFNDICDIHAPTKTIRFKQKSCPWLENRDDIFDLMHERDYQHQKAVKSKIDCNDHWSKYKELRNNVNVLMKDAKREYYTNEINSAAGNSKKMWKTLKELLPSKKGHVTTLPTTFKSDTELANGFNTHFTNIGSNMNDSSVYLDDNCKDDYVDNKHDKFTFDEITINQVIDELNAIPQKKAGGLDNVCTKLLKYGTKAIAPVLCNIFNICLKQGTVPDNLKVARVTPIFKNGDKDDLSNYRPISILPVCSKVLERIVHKQLYNYVSVNNIMYTGQSGFRQNHSTSTALIKTIDKWNIEIDQGNYVGAIFVDLSKAFDMVNHKLLLHKLKLLGITGTEFNWFMSYLSNRTQHVSVNDSISSANDIKSGVPQGSILGPLLFLLFINDMPDNIKNSCIDMYADDTLMYVCHEDISTIENYLNEDLKSLNTWLSDNLMKVNVSKTKIMLLGTPSKTGIIDNINVFMNGNKLENVSTYKYLGVLIDANLKWKEQINNVCRKVCSALGIMRRIKPFVPQSSLITIYNTMILSHFDYGMVIWSNCGETNLSRLQKLQNAAMRIILGMPFRTHINDMLKALHFMDIKSRINYTTGCMMYKVLNDLAPSYLNNSFQKVNTIHDLNTRSSNAGDLYIPRIKSYYGKSAFQHKGSVLWNVIDKSIRNANSLMCFKIAFKKELKL